MRLVPLGTPRATRLVSAAGDSAGLGSPGPLAGAAWPPGPATLGDPARVAGAVCCADTASSTGSARSWWRGGIAGTGGRARVTRKACAALGLGGGDAVSLSA
ncbi:MAG: hypothetical protein LBE08_13565 [Bifidobacteriaceae bacterium]|nr:hypothetical protein [Bifidobacteriaceae bacterium]